MARKILCDVCQHEITDVVRVEFLDGEHPHCGSVMSTTKDVCFNCLEVLSGKKTLKMDVEWTDVWKLMKKS